MQTLDSISQRKSCRAFLHKPVPREIIENLLNSAACSPSGANIQPWEVAIVTGTSKQKLSQAMQQQFADRVRGKMDYQYYPQKWSQTFDDRRKACGAQLYQTLQIENTDKKARLAQWAANYCAFDAPVMLLFFLEQGLETGSWLDYGMYLQTLMLAATDSGLATCPQAALAEYPEVVKQILGYPQDSILICGMALGYEDTEAVVNSYRTPRAAIAEYTRFFD